MYTFANKGKNGRCSAHGSTMQLSFYHLLAILAVVYGAYEAFTGNTIIGLVGLGLAVLLLWIAPRRRR